MITSAQWPRLKYRYPNNTSKGIDIPYLIGFDSEALTTGTPFLFCMSDGETFEHCDTVNHLENIFYKYKGNHIAVYNLKYDSGAFLYHLPDVNKRELWERTETVYNSIRISYIPHKNLRLRFKKDTLNFWDVSQYFAMSLDAAAKRYLNSAKKDMETKSFTPRYVAAHRKKIISYCIKDAVLCADLGNYLLKKLKEFGIRSTSLYSSASLSFRYFADRGKIVNVWNFYKYRPRFLQYAMDAYEGGKFEITSRGAFMGYEYDLVSAYPAEIRNLVDISIGEIFESKKYEKDAVYGFLRVKVFNPGGAYLPCGIMKDKVRIYPAGEFYTTITKQEYEFMKSIGVHCRIINAVWCNVGKRVYPYRKIVDELFDLKHQYKGKDAMLYEVSKRMLNSFYGKTVQVIENWKGQYVAGIGFNPVYGAAITAGARVKVAAIQNRLKNNCLAVHTDSVITLCPLEEKEVSGKLGEFDFVCKGPGVLVACGQYEIGGQAAYKGFEPIESEEWKTILKRNAEKSIIRYPYLKVESWIEAVAKGHYDKINLFTNETKKIDLNADSKRTWLKNIKGRDLLYNLETSLPLCVVEKHRPKEWN
jgi:hypothetical protein